jgi:hypothetical protein
MTDVRWIIPQAKEPASQEVRDASAFAAVAPGRPLRIGLLDNTKDNARLLLQQLGERASRDFDIELLLRRKGNATLGASVELLDELAREADCVLTAMAD